MIVEYNLNLNRLFEVKILHFIEIISFDTLYRNLYIPCNDNIVCWWAYFYRQTDGQTYHHYMWSSTATKKWKLWLMKWVDGLGVRSIPHNNISTTAYYFFNITNYPERERERERGQWAVHYTSPQSFIITFSFFVGLTTLGPSVNFDLLVY